MVNNNQNLKPEEDFNEVFSKPQGYFVLVYPLILVVLILGGLKYVKDLPFVQLNSIPAVYESKDKGMKEITAKKGSITEGVEIAEVKTATEDMLATGADLYKANCASCHGDDGKGDGAAGAMLNPLPRNFEQNDGWVNGRDLAGMYKTLEEGIVENGMASYSYMPVKDRFAIIHYIQSNFMQEVPEVTDDMMAQLEATYSLSQGRKEANKIPVSLAVKKVIEDNSAKMNMIEEIIVKVTNDNSADKDLLLKVTNNLNQTVSFLANTNEWKNGIDSFKSVAQSNMIYNGFSATLARLNETELQSLYQYLLNLYNFEMAEKS